ncbi:MAG: acyl-CoA dehydrogenase [Oscillochloridaceae bacterium umkhey_bin13]
MSEINLEQWIGRQELLEEVLGEAQAQAAAATLDRDSTAFVAGAALPLLWHWFYFVPRAPQARLNRDGHPQRGDFMPPITLPRRMFAGSTLDIWQPLKLGLPTRREGEIRAISQKTGRSGTLAFVTVGYRYFQAGQLCLEEEQAIVYREPGVPLAAPIPSELPPVPAGAWTRMVTPDPRLLFRFSALTFNAHRIHYDRPYATGEEGYPGLVVHGPLTAVLLLELVCEHYVGPITSFSFRGLAPLFDLHPFRLVAIPHANEVALEAHGPDGSIAMRATAGW